ncbi:hypothetical protein H6F78_04505 [Coleofasciculus sp. FACHB-64]|nr:hypothetical protein [Coleofasciculus sp. FACHB-64]
MQVVTRAGDLICRKRSDRAIHDAVAARHQSTMSALLPAQGRIYIT